MRPASRRDTKYQTPKKIAVGASHDHRSVSQVDSRTRV